MKQVVAYESLCSFDLVSVYDATLTFLLPESKLNTANYLSLCQPKIK